MTKSSYFRSLLSFFSKVILFCFFIYLLIERGDSIDFARFQIVNYSSLFICLLLIPLNWLFEWMKWKEILIAIDEKTNSNNLTAFASGIVSSFLTPSLSGNFLGRMYYYDKNKRWKITGYSVLANFSQFLVSILFGIMAFQFIPMFFEVKNWVLYLISFVSLLLFGLYFFGEKVFKNVSITRLQSLFIQIENGPARLKLLFLSFLRYIVFVTQYALALNAFGEKINTTILGLIAIIFLLVTLTPSLFFGKVVVRESISISVFSFAGIDPLTAACASFTTWIFNLLIPAMIALIYVKKKK
ncbi:MAG: hypothetical protein ACKO7P_15425 [Bacteroidota bacterium]